MRSCGNARGRTCAAGLCLGQAAGCPAQTGPACGLDALRAAERSALLAVTFNTIRLQILTMRDEIEVSKLIGATNGFIRRPFLYFGAIRGWQEVLSAGLSFLLGIHLIDEQLKILMQLYEINLQLYHLSLEDSLSLLLFRPGWAGWVPGSRWEPSLDK